MLPKHHIITGAIISTLLYIIFPLTIIQTLTIFLSSFLIDFDHYLYYLIKKKDTNPINATKWFYKYRTAWLNLSTQQRKQYKRPLFIFHNIECWLILLVLAQINSLTYFILLGIAIHISLDYLEIIYLKEPLYQKFSIILTYLKNKKKRFIFGNQEQRMLNNLF